MSDKLSPPSKPLTVLILGGTTTVARALCLYLLEPKSSRASFVRLADRFSVSPPTTYLDSPFLSLLGDPNTALEYKQVNLGSVDRHEEVFTPPRTWKGEKIQREAGGGFDVVFDLTGETGFDKPELIQITHTYQLALSLATSASKLPPSLMPRSYVRLTFPFYEMKSLPSSSIGHAESAELRQDGVRGRWWHETLRGTGLLPGLNFGVVRCGAWYGRGTWEGEILPRLVIGHIYQYLKEEMKFLYNSDLRINTIHSLDIAQALYLLSLYLLSTPRATVLSQSASPVAFSFRSQSSSSSTLSLSSSSKNKRISVSETWRTIPTVVSEKEKVQIPLFNVVDEGDSTQGSLARAVAQVWGIKFGFLNSTMAILVQQFAKTDFEEMVEDVNEMHVQAWSDMLSRSNPPIDSSPITPFLDQHAFRKMAICLDGSKAKRILGFKPLFPGVEVDELRRIVHDFQEDRLW
ncbi:hypothetical protein IAR55_000843 [Kwoniella newhampshirensis]|uniref:NAD-dependent epimerase/dehydratase domain-containing protein n=1 Tax=Kwoniella newhampshirensis TaxID=1651941 RepID=A0AAW0Z4B2_9TREE